MENKDTHRDKEAYLAKWLNNELTDSELKQYMSDEEIAEYIKLKKGIQLYEDLEAPLDVSYAKLEKRIKKRPKVIPLYQRIAAAAASVVILVALFTVFSTNETSYETDIAQQQSIILPDGSEVLLNAKSELSYDETSWEENRTVNLNGEAYFKVAKGKTFTVKTANGNVEVLGTQFNVNSFEDFFEVNCFEGKVRVAYVDENTILMPHESTRKINGNAVEYAEISDGKPSWVNGESTFRSVPLRYVITSLKHQYDVDFNTRSIDDSELFTGSFTHSDLNTALITVFKTMNIDYKQVNLNLIELNKR